MAGILSGLFSQEDVGEGLQQHLVDFLNGKQTGKEENGGTEVEEEREYCFFLKLTDGQMEKLADVVAGVEREFIYEGKLGRNKEVRIRKKLHSNFDFDKASIETKYQAGEKAIEIKNELAEETFDRLIPVCDLVSARVRFELDAGNDLEWEVDVFLLPNEGEPRYSNWVKLELEVDKFEDSDEKIIASIPFEYETLINTRAMSDGEGEQVNMLWNVVYNYISVKSPFI